MSCQGIQLLGIKVVGQIVFSFYHTDYKYFNYTVFQMLSALNDVQKPMIELAKCIDPNLTRYHEDSVLQVFASFFFFFISFSSSNFFGIEALLHVFTC